ncbi:MAG: ComF family protein [Bacteroidales bacterium]|nr:ComF family protein [Bacteroidales bacterium]
MAVSIAKGLRSLADLIAPRSCICCGRELLTDENHICVCCLSDLPGTHFEGLRGNAMSELFNSLLQREMGDAAVHHPFSYATALYFYKGGFREISKALKYRRNFAAGDFFADELARALSGSGLYSDVDAVVGVPLHWMRRFARGYNQAEVIARRVASGLGVPHLPRLLRRARRTRSQTTLGPESRRANTRGAFSARPCGKQLRHILLVDDVCTTGATLAACALALYEVFPQARVSVATLAFVER